MAAIARVSGRVQLRGIRLTELSLTTTQIVPHSIPLEPVIDQECIPLPSDKGLLAVECRFTFGIRSAGNQIAESKFKYHIRYKVTGEEPLAEQDIIQFAAVNGAYHAWPFVRELIFNLTARMGFQPFTLPVLSFMGLKTQTEDQAVPAESAKK